MQIYMEHFWEQGERTERNQDSLAFCQFVVSRKRCAIAVVCDGIGSLENSEESSGFVTEQAVNWFCRDGPKLFSKRLNKRKIKRAGQRLLFGLHLQMKDSGRKIGTTVSMLLLIERNYFIWNVGDSRIYLKRKRKELILLTKDDVESGYLTRCVGSFPWKGIEMKSGRIKSGDSMFICTDGFWKFLTKEILNTVLTTEANEEKMKRILREVNGRNRRRGEKDDSSAILVIAI